MEAGGPERFQRGSGRTSAMQQFYVMPGDSVSFAKTVGETDVYLFAGITGDFAVNHVNEQYMARSKYG
jgi:3-hydroxybutyryl-CoA dehydratase